jgi:glyoxylase-like metal-dependent hydrolase (beta-lactamase superfamily II)
MYMHLEDEFGDVVGKARRGQEISTAQLSGHSGLSVEELNDIEAYRLTPDIEGVDRLADSLGLHRDKLRASAGKRYFPLFPAGRPVERAVVEMLVLGCDFLMNGYVVGCAETRQGTVIDPGFEAEKILKTVETLGLDIVSVLLTHGHGDHTGALSEVCQATSAPAFISHDDSAMLGSLRTKIEGEFVEGQILTVGNLRFRVTATGGHTPGGMTIVHDQFAFVGDALFAGSLGGTQSRAAYEKQRQAVRQAILGLDEQVILYPGHGPATTVGEERASNPFFT